MVYTVPVGSFRVISATVSRAYGRDAKHEVPSELPVVLVIVFMFPQFMIWIYQAGQIDS